MYAFRSKFSEKVPQVLRSPTWSDRCSSQLWTPRGIPQVLRSPTWSVRGSSKARISPKNSPNTFRPGRPSSPGISQTPNAMCDPFLTSKYSKALRKIVSKCRRVLQTPGAPCDALSKSQGLNLQRKLPQWLARYWRNLEPWETPFRISTVECGPRG